MLNHEKRFGLTPERVEFYRENGYLLVEGLLTGEEAACLREEAHGLMRRLLANGAANAEFAGWGSAAKVTELPPQLQHCHNVEFHSALLQRLIADPRLMDRVADLIGPNLQLHHTKLFIKPPEKGAPFPLHQDYPYFPHENHTMMAAIIHFDDAPLEKGCVRVVPRSHKLGPLEHVKEGSPHLPLEEYPLEAATALPARAGDVLLFNYLTIHGSGVNTSDEARTTLLMQMRDPADPPLYGGRSSLGEGMMLRGIDPLASAGVQWRPSKGA